jgi:predicted ribosomally synthesized peptide with nif11-like leader
MARADAHALLARLRDDDAFRERVMAAGDAETESWIIADEGFLCTAADLAAVHRALGDDELVALRREAMVGR